MNLRDPRARELAQRLAAIAGDLKAKAGKGGRPVSKDEIDDMWGHP